MINLFEKVWFLQLDEHEVVHCAIVKADRPAAQRLRELLLPGPRWEDLDQGRNRAEGRKGRCEQSFLLGGVAVPQR